MKEQAYGSEVYKSLKDVRTAQMVSQAETELVKGINMVMKNLENPTKPG